MMGQRAQMGPLRGRVLGRRLLWVLVGLLVWATVTDSGPMTSHGAPTPHASAYSVPSIRVAHVSVSGSSPTSTDITPADVEVDSAGHLFIADSGNNDVWLLNQTSGPANLFGQSIGAGQMAIIAGNNSAGFGGDGASATVAALNGPQSLAIDHAGNLYIADSGNSRVREVLAATGVITTVAGGGTGCPNQSSSLGDGCPATQAPLGNPSGVALDNSGNLYIADSGNSVIRKVQVSDGTITTIVGDGTFGYAGDGGPASQAELDGPQSVVVDGNGNIYINDFHNQRIRKVTTDGNINLLAGDGTTGYAGDGDQATNASLNNPGGLAVDSAGNLYIADTGNSVIREVIASSGVMTTVAGTGNAGTSGDGGPATQANLDAPQGIAVDHAGNLFIGDHHALRVREVLASNGTISTIAGTGSFTAQPTPLPTAVPTDVPVEVIPEPTGVPAGNETVSPDTGGVIQAQVDLQNTQTSQQITQTFTLLVPSDAVTGTTAISAAVIAPAAAPTTTATVNNIGVGAAISLTARIPTGTSVTVFSHPLLLQLSYDPALLNGIDPQTLTLAYFDTATRTWISLPTTVDTTAHLLSASVAHFTLFQARATARTAAQLKAALSRPALTLLSTKTVKLPPQAKTSSLPGGIPLVITLPHGLIVSGSPAAVHVLGAPKAHLQVTFHVAAAVVSRSAVLDGQGYAAVAAPTLSPVSQTTCRTVTVKVKGKNVKQQVCTPIKPHTVCTTVKTKVQGKVVSQKVCTLVGVPQLVPQTTKVEAALSLGSITIKMVSTFTLVPAPKAPKPTKK